MHARLVELRAIACFQQRRYSSLMRVIPVLQPRLGKQSMPLCHSMFYVFSLQVCKRLTFRYLCSCTFTWKPVHACWCWSNTKQCLNLTPLFRPFDWDPCLTTNSVIFTFDAEESVILTTSSLCTTAPWTVHQPNSMTHADVRDCFIAHHFR